MPTTTKTAADIGKQAADAAVASLQRAAGILGKAEPTTEELWSVAPLCMRASRAARAARKLALAARAAE